MVEQSLLWQQRQQVVLRPHRPQFLPPQLPVAPLQTRRRPMRHLSRRQMAQSFLTLVTPHACRRAHNPPRPFPTLHQTARIQQPPRRRKSRRPNAPPVLPQQVKQGQLMRRSPPYTNPIPAAMAPSPSVAFPSGGRYSHVIPAGVGIQAFPVDSGLRRSDGFMDKTTGKRTLHPPCTPLLYRVGTINPPSLAIVRPVPTQFRPSRPPPSNPPAGF